MLLPIQHVGPLEFEHISETKTNVDLIIPVQKEIDADVLVVFFLPINTQHGIVL